MSFVFQVQTAYSYLRIQSVSLKMSCTSLYLFVCCFLLRGLNYKLIGFDLTEDCSRRTTEVVIASGLHAYDM